MSEYELAELCEEWETINNIEAQCFGAVLFSTQYLNDIETDQIFTFWFCMKKAFLKLKLSCPS